MSSNSEDKNESVCSTMEYNIVHIGTYILKVIQGAFTISTGYILHHSRTLLDKSCIAFAKQNKERQSKRAQNEQ